MMTQTFSFHPSIYIKVCFYASLSPNLIFWLTLGQLGGIAASSAALQI